ncbi:MlaD family protein [Flavisolibacter nicotianae]|uniref:MlaD family protein n=1 Tax=Flavisolibacter nicotianae TaxID=2364882 RepID=UPI000EB3BEF5|nr:MlaD family protein [Flavisolibacter nicotianae]
MKLSNEVKVGLLAIAAILILVIGFNFLKGKSVFSKPFVLYARFPDIGGLSKSNQVKINGLNVGTVAEFVPADKEVNSIIVELHVDKAIAIPRNSIAIIDGSLLGSPYINIEKGPANLYLKSGDTISTRTDMSLLSNLQAQVAPTLTRLNETFDSLKIVIGGLNSIFDPHTKSNLRDLVSNLTVSSAQLSKLLDVQTGALAQSMGNVNAITGNLARNNDVINSSLRNVEVTTSRLANANIEGVVSALQSTIGELQSTITRFNTNSGTLGLLMNDRQLYDRLGNVSSRLDKVALSAEILFDDIRIHPKRYVNISVFGGKNAGEPITSPAPKDTLPR